MTQEEAIARLDEMPEKGDAEGEHWRADLILLDVLKESGQQAVADAWHRAKERVGFWYA